MSAYVQHPRALETNQRYWCFVEYPGPHLVYHVRVSRYANVGDECRKRRPMHARHRLRLRRSDGGLDSSSTDLAHLAAHGPQVIHVPPVYRQIVVLSTVGRALRVRPPIESTRTRVDDLIRLRAGKTGSKGDIERQIDRMARHRRGRRHGVGASRWSLDRHVVLRMWTAEAHGRRHLLPAVPSLAGEVG